jgi:hypothetical protein
MTLHLLVHEDTPNTTADTGCARVWIDETDAGSVLVQM